MKLYIGKDKQSCKSLNENEKLSQLETLLKTWSKRNHNIFGKVKVYVYMYSFS